MTHSVTAPGDELLRMVAARLREACRAGEPVGGDTVVSAEAAQLARIDGDEFMVLLPARVGVEKAGLVAERMSSQSTSPCA